MIGNESQIKILAYVQNVDGQQLLKTAARKSRSKSPLVSAGPTKSNSKSVTQLPDSPTSPNEKREKSTGEPSNADPRDQKSKNRESKGAAKQPKKESESTNNQRLASFEIASFHLPDYPNEKIVFVKFLDDNDPRLLFLVTYSLSLRTTYMKVVKIEKIKPDLISPGQPGGRRMSEGSPMARDQL